MKQILFIFAFLSLFSVQFALEDSPKSYNKTTSSYGINITLAEGPVIEFWNVSNETHHYFLNMTAFWNIWNTSVRTQSPSKREEHHLPNVTLSKFNWTLVVPENNNTERNTSYVLIYTTHDQNMTSSGNTTESQNMTSSNTTDQSQNTTMSVAMLLELSDLGWNMSVAIFNNSQINETTASVMDLVFSDSMGTKNNHTWAGNYTIYYNETMVNLSSQTLHLGEEIERISLENVSMSEQGNITDVLLNLINETRNMSSGSKNKTESQLPWFIVEENKNMTSYLISVVFGRDVFDKNGNVFFRNLLWWKI